MATDPKKILRELVEEVLDEMTTSAAAGPYMSKNAFRGGRNKDAVAARSMPGGKVVHTKHDETDDTTVNEESESLPVVRRELGENSWPGGKRHAMHQDDHEAWNAKEFPGTRQLCTKCGEPTERCEEDALYSDDGVELDGPLCVDCWEKTQKELNEGRYRNFRQDESMKSHTKVCFGLNEAKKMLREVEFLMDIVERLKTEDGVDKSQLWKRTRKDLSEINKRTKAIARRVYRIGKS